ncbi:hypothetical protein M413DRAFT_162356 [Hebeloma cylindrosporum]|uniref:Uncharacterized protein n=1 Tax=Hebeloma cylindrosporum TaxID=76867 RepID=A0A0C3CA53_HEBCY|nr:hypothetical protein M413DRAFT_162356 [Hebeloma cylindrosporum h7]
MTRRQAALELGLKIRRKKGGAAARVHVGTLSIPSQCWQDADGRSQKMDWVIGWNRYYRGAGVLRRCVRTCFVSVTVTTLGTPDLCSVSGLFLNSLMSLLSVKSLS